MYHFDCICGAKLTTPAKTGACPHCARLYDLRWPNDAAPVITGAEPAEAAQAAKLVA